ncbi:MAG: tyrosine--tRNA ligase [Bdellovibrionales bacterium]|nr:tyrosine--tRNA ligase [Bdellovibrionales bacterium]
MNKEQKVDDILSRGIIKEILPDKNKFREALLGNKQLRFYIGADATGSSLHLSHAKNFMLLEEFRQLGHKVFVLFGDLTACIGDPSDRDSARSKLTRDKARQFAEDWVEQIKPIINFEDENNPAEVVFNSTWFDKFSTTELLELFSTATVQQMLERDMFEKRMKENKPIFLHEFLYPMFQGYDSVALDVDVELCGTDQIFNALSGRDLLKRFKRKEKFVVAVNLMENPKTGELMSKTNGTGVFLGTGATNMFGQIMALPDEMIEIVLVNNTRLSKQSIADLEIEKDPRNAKIFSATEIVSTFYGQEEAQKAKQAFIETFSKGTFPKNAPVISPSAEKLPLLQLISECDSSLSKSEIRRLIKQNAVSINGDKCSDEHQIIDSTIKLEIKIGKQRFFQTK